MSEQGALVSAKTICLVLKVGRFGNHRLASMADVSVDADKTLLRMTKTLLDSPELAAIQKHDNALSARVRGLAFKALFKGGVYLLPLTLVPTIEQILHEAYGQRKVLVDRACDKYAQRTAETSARLGVTYDVDDYPSVDRFRAAFYLEHSYVTFDTPGKLKAISAELFEAEKAKAAAKLEAVADECKLAMRAGLLQLVQHLAERLTPDEEGKQKRLHQSTIQNFNEFLALFEMRDVTGDTDLANLVAQAREVMTGVDRDVLKTDELVRQKVQTTMAALVTQVEPLVLEMGTRQIDLEDEVA